MKRNVRVKFTPGERKRYRIMLGMVFLVNLLVIGMWFWQQMDNRVPNHIYLFQNQNTTMDFEVPLWGQCNISKDDFLITNDIKNADKWKRESVEVSGNAGKSIEKKKVAVNFQLNRPVAIQASKVGRYQAQLKLFGIIPYKNIQFDVIEQEKVMPSGKAVGLYIQSDGIMVLGTAKVQGKDGLSYEPAKDILQPGDTIYQVENTPVKNINQVAEIVEKCHKKKITLKVKRNGNALRVKIDLVQGKDGDRQLGVWLREDTEGIGTLSFVTRKNQFAALGHGITDIDTGKVIPLEQGTVYSARIEDIKKGKRGEPGELVGSVSLDRRNCVGSIESNSSLGITGKIQNSSYAYREEQALPIGLKQDVKKGKAWILCQLGMTVEKYEVSIEEINLNSRDNKGMVIRMTDKELLKRSGGIVQGMSGAPIIQNGKVIGAVTHVFVNDPTGGYGTFMENML